MNNFTPTKRMKAFQALGECASVLAILDGAFGNQLKASDRARLTSAHIAIRAALQPEPEEDSPRRGVKSTLDDDYWWSNGQQCNHCHQHVSLGEPHKDTCPIGKLYAAITP